jgi:hypothetical protein
VAEVGSVAVTAGAGWLVLMLSLPPPQPDTVASSVIAAPAIQKLVFFMKGFLT